MNYYENYYQEIDDNYNFEKIGSRKKFKERDPEKIRRTRKLKKRKRRKENFQLK